MRGAQVFGKGQYFTGEGRYALEVLKLFYKRTVMEGQAKESIISEFKVLESSRADVEPGFTRSVVFSFHHAGWLPRFKALVLALLGVDPDGKLPAAAEDTATDIYVALRDDTERQRLGLPDNFMAGRKVITETFPGLTRKGGPCTNMKWFPCE